ncbi:hypothetical protein ACLMJK_003785 [Lecanora helva]
MSSLSIISLYNDMELEGWLEVAPPSLGQGVDSVSTESEGYLIPSSHAKAYVGYYIQPDPGFERMARTSEWVQQQMEQDRSVTPEPEAHHDAPVTPPQRNSSQDSPNDRPDQSSHDQSMRERRAKRIYDIATLLGMRYKQSAIPVMLRVKPEAIAENIFQYMGAASSHRPILRSQGLSDVSNTSRHHRGSTSSKANHSISYRPSLGTQPVNFNRIQRQAPPPINIPLTQCHDGFVRFLQKHASPPHHRVTAGGRIVPAGPTSPPPMFDYNSLNELLQERKATAGHLRKEENTTQSRLQTSGGLAQPVPPVGSGDYNANQGHDTLNQAGLPIGSLQPMLPQENLLNGHQPQTSSTFQLPTNMTNLGILADGSTLVSYNGVSYRTYWNGLGNVMEPLPLFYMPPEQIDYQTAYPSIAQNANPHGSLNPSSHAPQMKFPLTDITNGSRGSNRKTSASTTSENVNNQEAELKLQLTNLDKHLALYHYELTKAEHSELVAERKYLVQAIDKIRVSKENTKRTIPIIAPDTGLPVTPDQGSGLYEQENPMKRSKLQSEASQKLVPGKGLSPAAAPFVPSQVRTASSNNQTKQTLEDIASAAVARKDRAINAIELGKGAQMDSHRDFSSSTSVLDPSDPAMRVIDHQDVEYASRYLYNWDFDEKVYCTTVAEFQEALKQVREQARRYGCFGGQSKDPAYDAEQDIWWAICDRDPIPLPPNVPDYESNPRPWNWEDSVFNFRVKESTATPNGFEDARRSPRLLGWDIATTEKLKDTVDVTRSYYAFKGQLPSVPFRTWAYDRKGNMVLVGSEIGPSNKQIDAVDYQSASASSKVVKSVNAETDSNRNENPHETFRTHVPKETGVIGSGIARQSGQHLNFHSAERDLDIKHSSESQLAKSTTDMGDLKLTEPAPRSNQTLVEDHPHTFKARASGHGSQEMKPSSKYRLNTIWENQYPIYDPRNPDHERLFEFDVRGQSAETRSPWGPEKSSRSPLIGQSEKSDVAKVNIPHATNSYSSSRADQNAHNVTSNASNISESTGAKTLLQKMLRSPTYATTKPASASSYGMKGRFSKFFRGGGEDSQHSRSVHKENAPSMPHAQVASGSTFGKDDHSSLGPLLKSNPDITVTKVESSPASPSCHAQSYVPHHQGRGLPHSAPLQPSWDSNSRNQSQEALSGPPPGTCYLDMSPVRGIYDPPGTFGFDGGADSQPPSNEPNVTKMQEIDPTFDLKGLTHADYETKRGDADSAWHKGAVNDYFQELAAKEREEIRLYHQSRGKDRI